METKILLPKYRKNKKPTKVRKPSKPLDGINHRLLREQAEAQAEAQAKVAAPVESTVPDDSAPVTRAELEAKATELGIPFNGRTSDKKLSGLIATALQQKGD
jgi:Tfp pilus assembly protein FimV